MTVAAAVCLAYFAGAIALDLVHPGFRAVEVWFGFETTGRVATLTAPIHWAIFAFGAWAFWRGKRWIVPWAAGYVLYAALCHLVWSEAGSHGRGWPVGLVQAVAISAVALVLLRLDARTPRAGGAER